MLVTDVPSTVNEPTGDIPRTSRARELVGALLLALVLVAVAVVISHDWRAFIDSLHKIGVGGVALSLAAALVGVVGTYLQWRSALIGLGVRFGVAEGARVFFVSQLGKYLPGSVWPVVMQMEAGRSRGASRRTMLAANLITVLLSVCVGLVFAGLPGCVGCRDRRARPGFAGAVYRRNGFGGFGRCAVSAGAGLREIVLAYVLVAVLTPGQVVAVVIASRGSSSCSPTC
jgi:hypothetical protein